MNGHDQAPEYTGVSLGNWLLTFLIMAIPFVNLIALLYWAFSSASLPSKRTWAQANLILIAILFALAILFSPWQVMPASPRF